MSHIKTIEIKNFKSIRQQKIEDCRRVNVFIGYPNVGKSNILEALGLFSFLQQMHKESFLFSSICRINHFSDLFFDKNLKQKANIIVNNDYTLTFEKEKEDSDFYIIVGKKTEFGNIAINTKVDEKQSFRGLYFNKFGYDNEIRDSEILKIKYYLFNNDTFFTKTKSTSLSIPNGDNLLDILQGNGDLRKAYSELLKSYNLRLNISDNYIGVAKELSDGTFVTFQNNLVSDTLRRLFFFKAAIQTNSESVLLFEEPEAHMFPPYIRKMTADIIFDKNNNQYFIATHSPYVLDELVEELEDELSVYLVDYKDGETKIIYLSREDLREVRDYGVDLFFNIESYLKNGQVHNA